MTIEKAMKHPAYKQAYNYAQSQGFRGGMNEPDFGWVVMAYLAGYNKGKKCTNLTDSASQKPCISIGLGKVEQ